ncbi:MAG: hypothetical protein E7508_11395 [Ruminococcus sp.]|nr:hypothetical protein [Ruminococcus sp.]
MKENETIKCNAIIHSASVAAGAAGAGLAQLPCSDNAIITPIQCAMAIGLAKVFGLELSEGAAQAAIGSAAASMVGRAASQVIIGWIPIAGNIVNAATAASLTETLGWILAKEFEKKAA